jgi:hypothetical protein
MNRIILKTIILFLYGACFGNTVTATKQYALWGQVSGVNNGENSCYIAIDDFGYGGRYQNRCHNSPHKNICAIAKIAIATGQNVIALIQEDPVVGYANDVISIEVFTKQIKAPPY